VRSSGYAKLLQQLQQWRADTPAALFYVDICRLRAVNRLASPDVADELVHSVEQIVKNWAGHDAVAGRLWSDEFIAVKAIDHAQEAAEEARNLRKRLTSLTYKGLYGETQISVSIGVVCTRPSFEWPALITQAADACEMAKERGLNQVRFHGAGGMQQRSPSPSPEGVVEFRQLRDAGSLSLHPQPIMAISGREPRIAKAEFLLRVEHNGVHVPPPGGMIEALEHHGLSTELDRFSSQYMLNWLSDNASILDRLSGISLNLSAPSFVDGLFMGKLFDEVKHAHLPRGKLSFEITETAAIQNLNVAAEVIEDFQSLGCRFSLDDFGSGLCSFGYLHSLPVDEVKIDGRFIREVAHSPVTQKIVRAIHQVARATGKTTVAEFVDDARKLAVLQDIGFDYAQGWLFYPTVHPDKFHELVHMPPQRVVTAF
jgi:diguanylate cyclase (GGDEF)-like protein